MYRRIVWGIVLVIGISGLAASATLTVNRDVSGNHTIPAALNDAVANIPPMIINFQGSPGDPHGACLQLPWAGSLPY